MLARRADLELPVAQGRCRRCSRPATAAILPDLPGFGRSDKPIDERLVLLRPPRRPRRSSCSRTSTCAARRSSCTTGAARSACGVAVELADRVDRLVLMDTGVFTGEQPMSEDWHRFREFVDRVEELPVEPARAARRARPTRATRSRPPTTRRSRARRRRPARARSRRSCRWRPTIRARRPAGARWPRCARTRARR